MTNYPSCDRRLFVSLVAGAATSLSGCSGARQALGSTPTDSGPPLFSAPPTDLLLSSTELPAGPTWTETLTERRESNSISVLYDVFEDGSRSHQASLDLTRQQTLDGSVFDHDKLVETYREEYDASVSALPHGDVASLAQFGDEAHALLAYRNVIVNIGFYEDGPVDRLERLIQLQAEKLDRLAP